MRYAQAGDYRRGIEMAKLIQGELLARAGKREEAKASVQDALEGFERLGIREGLNYEFAGRVHRLVGDYYEAEAYLLEGLELAKKFPVYLAALTMELALLHRDAGVNIEVLEETVSRTTKLYEAAGAPLRARAAKALLLAAEC